MAGLELKKKKTHIRRFLGPNVGVSDNSLQETDRLVWRVFSLVFYEQLVIFF